MAHDLKQNELIKRMWTLDEKFQTDMEGVTEEELSFWNTNLELIQRYYQRNKDYWNTKQKI